MKMLTRQKIIVDEACFSIKQCETSEYIQEHKFESIPNFGKVVAIAKSLSYKLSKFMSQLMFQKLKLML